MIKILRFGAVLLALTCMNVICGQTPVQAPAISVLSDPNDDGFADSFVYGLTAGANFTGNKVPEVYVNDVDRLPEGAKVFASSSVVNPLMYRPEKSVYVVDQMPDGWSSNGFLGTTRGQILDAAANTLRGTSVNRIAFVGDPGVNPIEQTLDLPAGSIQNLNDVQDPGSLRYILYNGGGKVLAQLAEEHPRVQFLNVSGAQSFDFKSMPKNVFTYLGVGDPALALKSQPYLKKAVAQGYNPAVAVAGFSYARIANGDKAQSGVVTIQKEGSRFLVARTFSIDASKSNGSK